jgi:hypothetical protein
MGSRTRPGSQQLQVLVDAALTDLVLIQVAAASSADAHRLILRDLAPTTIWMLQGPVERIGHLSTGTFLDLWWDVGSGLSDSSLPAVLGRADAEGQCLPDPRFLLRSPRIRGSGIQYDIEWVSGSAPGHTGACVLFLGPGRPSGP